MAWSIVGVGTVAETATTTLTLTEPAGVADGDLLIATIASRTTATTAPTSTGWAAVASQNNNNTLTTTSAIASGTMLVRIRSGTPTLAFTLPAGISVAMGRIVAYRGSDQTAPLSASFVPTANSFGSSTNASYATARAGTTATSTPGVNTTNIGAYFSTNYFCNQYFMTFDTSTFPAGVNSATLTFNVNFFGGTGDIWEVRQVSSAANLIAGDSLGAAGPVLGSANVPTATGRYTITLDTTSMSRASGTILCLHSQEQRLNVTPSGVQASSVNSIAAAAGLQPVLQPIAPSVIDVSTAVTTATNTTAVSVTGLTTTQDDDLIVAMAAGGQEAAWSAFNATTPAGASGATDTTTAPSATWCERADSFTATGADTSLAIFDAIKTAAGATGNLTATASLGAGHVVIAVAFKIAASGPVNKTLPAVAGSYALTGTAALLERGREVAADAGAYALTGAVATLTKGAAVIAYNLPAVTGSYALIGAAAGLYRGREVLAVAGSYALGGTAASLERGREVAGDAGAYALTGADASLERGREVLAVAGSYALSGVTASLERGRAAAAVAGAYALTGAAATITKGAALVNRTLPAVAGSYTLTGGAGAATAPSSSLLTSYTPGTDRNDFTGEVGVRLGIGASDIPFNWIGARRHSSAQTGTHTVTLYEWFGDTVVASATIDFTGVAVGSYAWASVPASTLLANGYYALLMPVTASDGQTWCNPGPTAFTGMTNVYGCYRSGGTLGVTGINEQFIGFDIGAGAAGAGATSLEYGRRVSGVAGSYTITGTPANLLRVGAKAIIGLPGSYALTGTATSLERGYEVLGVAGTYALIGAAATLTRAAPPPATIFVGLTDGVTDGVLGAGGSLPTGWTVIVNTASSTLTVSGHGVDDSVEYFDLQSTGGGEVIIYFSSGDDGIASSAGAIWKASAYLKAIASTLDSTAIGTVGLWGAAAETGGNYDSTAIATAGDYQASLRSVTYKLEVSDPATIAATGVLDFQSEGAFTVRIAARLELVSLGVLALSGLYGLLGTPAAPKLARKVPALVSSYALLGVATSLEYGREVLALAGSYALTGAAASFKRAYRTVAAGGSYTLTGVPVNLLTVGAKAIIGLPGSYALTGAATSLEYGREVAAGAGSYVMTASPVTLIWSGEVVPVTPGGQPDGDPMRRPAARRRRQIFIIVSEAAKKLVAQKSPLRKKRRKLAKLIAEEVLEEAGGLLAPDRLALELAIRRELSAIPLTESHTEGWQALQDALMQVITDAEQTAERLRAESEDEDDLLLLLAS